MLSEIHPADVDSGHERDGEDGEEVLAEEFVPVCAKEDAEADGRYFKDTNLPPGEGAV